MQKRTSKILNNILPCNRNLLKWGKSETNLCCFCQEEETISHLLFYCTYAESIWEVVNNTLLHGENATHDMILFGYDTDSFQSLILDHRLLYL